MRGDVGYPLIKVDLSQGPTGVASPLQVLGMPSESG